MQHESSSYERFRPTYPARLFRPLVARLTPDTLVVDLGTGTGLAVSALRSASIESKVRVKFVGTDPDPQMIERASTTHRGMEECKWRVAPAENTGLDDACAHAILIASSYHWLDRPRANAEILRISAPGAWVQIFEYQFPKCITRPELSEWIRRQFNRIWRFDGQKPRGKLELLCAELLGHPRVTEKLDLCREAGMDSFTLELDVHALTGLIFSQARAIRHLERVSNPVERQAHRDETLHALAQFYGTDTTLPFTFKLAGVLINI